jgi:DUF1016 N-terminal domain
MNIEKTTSIEYQNLLSQISTIFLRGQNQVARAVNAAMLETYWLIGQHIVEFEQAGKSKATYGDKLLQNLSKDLTVANGKGFSHSNLMRMRQFYHQFPIYATVSHKLSWSHYIELIKIDNVNERQFYENQAVHENWGILELR